jgi:hypothetical protein
MMPTPKMSDDAHSHFETPQDMWEYFFQEYNAQFWHDNEHKCYGKDCPERPPPRQPTLGWAEVARDIEVPAVSGFHPASVIKKGTTVRINMVSRFGDLGITPNLEQPNGYITRVSPTPENLTNCRLIR